MSGAGGNDRKLVIAVNDELKQSRVFESVVTFVHPATLANWHHDRLKKQQELKKLQKRADFFLKVLTAAAALGLLALIALSVVIIFARKRELIRKNHLLQEIEKREDLVANGHFVAARELADSFLEYFPDHTDMRAFRERLLDFTNNDPKKAQVAYVEAKKMRLRLEKYSQHGGMELLSGDERRALSELIAYNPELKVAYGQVLQIEDRQQKDKELMPRITSLKGLTASAKLHAARKECDALMQVNPGHPLVVEADIQLRELIATAHEFVAGCAAKLVAGDLAGAQTLLCEAKKLCIDSPDALAIETGLKPGLAGLELRSADSAFKAAILFKDSVVIGRPDGAEVPDIAIDDRRLSRRHARITITGTTVEIEDLGSTAGTFVAGEKISSATLSDGATLTLAKIFDFSVSIKQSIDGTVGSVLLTSTDHAYLLVKSSAQIGFDGRRFLFSKDGVAFYRQNSIVWGAQENRAIFFGGTGSLFVNGTQFSMEAQR